MYANLARLGDVYFALLGVYSDQLKANLRKLRDAKPRVLASSATFDATKDPKIAGLPKLLNTVNPA